MILPKASRNLVGLVDLSYVSRGPSQNLARISTRDREGENDRHPENPPPKRGSVSSEDDDLESLCHEFL